MQQSQKEKNVLDNYLYQVSVAIRKLFSYSFPCHSPSSIIVFSHSEAQLTVSHSW